MEVHRHDLLEETIVRYGFKDSREMWDHIQQARKGWEHLDPQNID